MSEHTTHHAAHAPETDAEKAAKKAKAAADKKEAAKKKRFSGSGLIPYLASLTPAELGKVCTFFDIPSGASVLKDDGSFGQSVAGHADLWNNLKNLEEAYAKYGDELCDTICDFGDLLAGKPVPVEEK